MFVFICLHFVLSLVAYVYALEGFKRLFMYHHLILTDHNLQIAFRRQ